jgi:prepilin peptidase CpaA
MQLLFAAVFAVCIAWAAISDVSGLRIRNEVSLILAGTFLVYALIPSNNVDLPMHLLVGGITLAVTFGFFLMHWLGGGDAKLIPAVALWVGPGQIASFVITLAILGGIFALALFLLQLLFRVFPPLEAGFPLPAVAAWARNGICPYAVPIAFAALLEAPPIFFR